MTQRIWNYQIQAQSGQFLSTVFGARICPCCTDTLLLSLSDQSAQSNGRQFSEYLNVLRCDACGWWFASRDMWDSSCGSVPDQALRIVMASGAVLCTFSTKLPDEHLRTLEQEIQQHILGRGKSDSWALLEDITTRVFREFGYQARVTARSKDGGIDVVVDHPDFGNVYAQVKHTKNKVNVRVLRELIGTMCINGVNTALLVTSSSFTRGVFRERSLAAQRGFVVELVDGQRFLASLNLSHRMHPPTIAEVLAIADPTIEIFRGEVNV